MRKIVVRQTNEQKVFPSFMERFLNFYEKNPSDMNSQRNVLDLLRSANQEDLFYIEEESSGHFGAVGLCFRHTESILELGGTRVIFNGLGLQSLLVSCRALNTLWYRQPEVIFTAIKKGNTASIKSCTKAGLNLWVPPQRFYYETSFSSEISASMGLVFLRCEEMTVPARLLMDFYNNPVRTSRETGEQLYIRLDFAMIRNPRMRSVIEGLAGVVNQ